MTPDALDTLRDRLLALRGDTLRQLAEADYLDAGRLRLVADAQIALAALDDVGVKPRRRRGGDPQPDKRARRDAALRELAPLVGPGVGVEKQARQVVDRLARYRPAAAETGRDRQLMRTIIETGLPMPGADRLKRILKSG